MSVLSLLFEYWPVTLIVTFMLFLLVESMFSNTLALIERLFSKPEKSAKSAKSAEEKKNGGAQ